MIMSGAVQVVAQSWIIVDGRKIRLTVWCSRAFGLVGASSEAYLSGIIGAVREIGRGICFGRDEEASAEVIEVAILMCFLVNVHAHVTAGK